MRASAKSSPSNTRSFGPGRSHLSGAQRARGHQRFNLWYHYSDRLKKDVILKSDVEFAHFCWLEADPTVQTYELEPEAHLIAVADEVHRTRFDALVHLHGARPQLREVKVSADRLDARELQQRETQVLAARAAGFDYVRITSEELAQHQQLISNWRCALAFLAACRQLSLEPFGRELRALVPTDHRITMNELLAKTDSALHSIYLASLFRCVRDGHLLSDLDIAPLCAHSYVWVPDQPHASR